MTYSTVSRRLRPARVLHRAAARHVAVAPRPRLRQRVSVAGACGACAQNRKTAGFGLVERLPGNVARVVMSSLVMSSFEPVDMARAAVTEHLSHRQLRLPPRVHLNDLWWRDTVKEAHVRALRILLTTPGLNAEERRRRALCARAEVASQRM